MRLFSRVGFLQTELPVTASLPSTVDALAQQWEVVEKPSTAPTWDFVWNGTAEEGREKQLVQQAFVASGNEVPPTRVYPLENIHVADAALKVRDVPALYGIVLMSVPDGLGHPQ